MEKVKGSGNFIQYKDPVCGMWVSEENAQAKVSFDGKNFYFCSLECAQKFNSNPQDYINTNHAPEHDHEHHRKMHDDNMQQRGKMNHGMGHGCGNH